MAKVNKECKVCGRAAKALASRLGYDGYCTKHARMEIAKNEAKTEKIS